MQIGFNNWLNSNYFPIHVLIHKSMYLLKRINILIINITGAGFQRMVFFHHHSPEFLCHKLLVVSIGVNHTFKVVFTPLEYIPNIPPLSHYVINTCLYLPKTLHFFGSRFYLPQLFWWKPYPSIVEWHGFHSKNYFMY